MRSITRSKIRRNSKQKQDSAVCVGIYGSLYFPANSELDVQVTVTGASSEAEAAKIARSVASSSLTKV